MFSMLWFHLSNEHFRAQLERVSDQWAKFRMLPVGNGIAEKHFPRFDLPHPLPLLSKPGF